LIKTNDLNTSIHYSTDCNQYYYYYSEFISNNYVRARSVTSFNYNCV